LAAAVRLLRQAGRPIGERRTILRRVPPFDTHGRYEVAGRSASYRLRNPRRTARELDLLRRVWPGREGDLVLDSPAGTGRLAVILTHELGARRIAADRARAMLLEGRGQGRGGDTALLLLQADAMQLPCRDRSVDGVVVFRLLHHLDTRAAQRVLAEACRVAERFVVVSFFHPVSFHGLSRRLREIGAGRARTRHALSLRTLRTWMAGHGFVEAAHAADAAFRRDFWLAAFVRAE
jgi:ubiquinone/menaquinone biosynthesis C-methylase UbiE